MANIKSAKKRILVTETRTARNKAIKSEVKTMVKKVYAAIDSKDQEAAKAALKAAVSTMNKATSKGRLPQKHHFQKDFPFTESRKRDGLILTIEQKRLVPSCQPFFYPLLSLPTARRTGYPLYFIIRSSTPIWSPSLPVFTSFLRLYTVFHCFFQYRRCKLPALSRYFPSAKGGTPAFFAISPFSIPCADRLFSCRSWLNCLAIKNRIRMGGSFISEDPHTD